MKDIRIRMDCAPPLAWLHLLGPLFSIEAYRTDSVQVIGDPAGAGSGGRQSRADGDPVPCQATSARPMTPPRLWVGAAHLAVPVTAGPLMYCHQAVAGIPLDGNCVPDVQEEHGGLFSGPCPPPCIGRLTAKILPGLSG